MLYYRHTERYPHADRERTRGQSFSDGQGENVKFPGPYLCPAVKEKKGRIPNEDDYSII